MGFSTLPDHRVANAIGEPPGLVGGMGGLGGAAGPVLATQVYAAGGADGFTWVFLLIAGTGLVAVCILPFSVAATRRMLEIVAT